MAHSSLAETDVHDIGFIGFGEAAAAFTTGWRTDGLRPDVAAYDILFDDPVGRAAKERACRNLGVTPLPSAALLARQSRWIIAAVTADQVERAAVSVAPLRPGTPYLDINSAAPAKKLAAAQAVGESYLDVAVLSPVMPKRHASPMLVGGSRAAELAGELQRWFPNAEVVAEEVGVASLVKMIRSIFVKGLEAVTTECALAARQAGLADRVWPSLDNVLRFPDSRTMAGYMLDRVATHGVRRAAEMDEVCDTLAALGLPSWMSQGAARTQRLVGALDLAEPPHDGTADEDVLSRAVLRAMGKRGADDVADSRPT